MLTDHCRGTGYKEGLLRTLMPEELQQQGEPKHGNPSPRGPNGSRLTMETLEKRWRVLATRLESREALADTHTLTHMEHFQHNIENFIGSVKLPVGLAGPLRVNGLFAQGDYYVPLATTEAALVASYHRGTQVISRAGGGGARRHAVGRGYQPRAGFRLSHAGRGRPVRLLDGRPPGRAPHGRRINH